MQQIFSGLNEVQREAVLHKQGPLLVLAGAGSGKTRVITQRIAHLIYHEHVNPSQILAITFTNKAANEMKERIAALVGDTVRSMWVGTFHSMMLRILRPHAERLGFTTNFNVIDTSDQKSILKNMIKERGIFLDHEADISQLLNFFSKYKSRMLNPDDAIKQAAKNPRERQICEVYAMYQEKLKELNVMDFDDILCYAVQLLRDIPDVLNAFQQRFEYVLVDEYQDTNHVQYLLVKLLSAPQNNICVVGDDDQSIYSFRGANIANILNFEQDYRQAKVVKLEQNYRSSGCILAAANAVIKHNKERTAKELWTSNEQGEKIKFYHAENQYDEARYIVRQIRRLQQTDGLNFDDFAVLYRVNALSRSIEQGLREEGIPYRIYGGLRFYERREIKDTLAYLRLVVSDEDNHAFDRIINVPKRNIGSTTLNRIATLAAIENISQIEVCRRADQYPEISTKANILQKFASLIDGWRKYLDSSEYSLSDFVELVEEESGLLTEQRQKQQNKTEAEEARSRIANLNELVSDAVEFEQQMQAEQQIIRANQELEHDFGLANDEEGLVELKLRSVLSSFLERAVLSVSMDSQDEEATVKLMSIHSAKGLEFDTVFVAGMNKDIFPSSLSTFGKQVDNEEIRLAYVAITRAKRQLYLLSAASRLLYGRTMYCDVSEFIDMIPELCMEKVSDQRKRKVHTDTEHKGSRINLYDMASNIKQVNKVATNDLGLDDIAVGMQLRHQRFGIGELKKIDALPGDLDAILTLDFAGKTKRLMLKTTPLEIVE